MSVVEQLTAKLTAIADAIREQNGLPWTMSIDEMPVAITNLELADEVPSVENGFTVNFHNDNDELVDSHSIKCGYPIAATLVVKPYYWVDENENAVATPVMSSVPAVFNLYPRYSDLAKRLYAFYQVNETDYPYALIAIVNRAISSGIVRYYYAVFTPEPFIVETGSGNYLGFKAVTTGNQTYAFGMAEGSVTDFDASDFEAVYNIITSKVTSVEIRTFSNCSIGGNTSDVYECYGNQYELTQYEHPTVQYHYIGDNSN